MRWQTITGIVVLCLAVLTLVAFLALEKKQVSKRDVPSLLNYYYRLNHTAPWKAKEALELILSQDPNHVIATRALAYWYVQQGDIHTALTFLENSHKHFPYDGAISFELAKLYIMIGQVEKAKPLLGVLTTQKDQRIRQKAARLYETLFPDALYNHQIAANKHSYIAPVTNFQEPDIQPLYDRAIEMAKIQPDLAESYFKFIISVKPNAADAYKQLGYLKLQQHKQREALSDFLTSFNIKPRAQLALDMAYLYAQTGQKDIARDYFQYARAKGNNQQQEQAQRALAHLHGVTKNSQDKTPFTMTRKTKLLEEFYTYKHSNHQRAWKVMRVLLDDYPGDVFIWKEAAYYAVSQENYNLALKLWHHIYALSPKPEYAQTIAYLYDTLGDKYQAYRYFQKASQSHNPKIKQEAEMARTNLKGAQIDYLPSPYFAEVFVAPFYYDRFDLSIIPIIARTGIVLNAPHCTELYLSYRSTRDNRSGTPLQNLLFQETIPQIFQDNLAVYAVGFRSQPWLNIPLSFFLEVGRAQNLLFMGPRWWRNDIRTGMFYYNEWGMKPTYAPTLQFPLKWASSLYSDLIYFSRYNNNIIGSAWFRPGIRLARYHAASVDFFLANYLIGDSNHDFFNNIYSIGPGLEIIPNNRWNIAIRLESLQNYYIPVNSPTPNPFGSKYYTNIALIKGFFRF